MIRSIFCKSMLYIPRQCVTCQHCQSKQIVAAVSSFNQFSTSSKNDRTSLKSNNLYLFKRSYSIGDYDKLWQAVTSGKGKGRSGKKKTKPKNVDGEFLKFGSANMTFPGLNEQIKVNKHHQGRKTPIEERREGQSTFVKSHRFRFDPLQRGWAGTSWPGRHAESPVLANGDVAEDFDSIVIEVKKVSVTRASGRRRRTSALVVVGNKKGSIGWAIGKAPFASAAIRKARNKAINYLHYVPICEGDTIYHNLRTKIKNTKVIFERKVPGYGRRCQRIVRAIMELAGIENIRCKVVGRTTPLTVVRTTFQGLKMQETHQELAERTGKYVVEYREECGNRPVVVATPSESALNRRLKEESESKEDDVDITTYFDPFRGAHRPKKIGDIQ